jgi:hypothetical protein
MVLVRLIFPARSPVVVDQENFIGFLQVVVLVPVVQIRMVNVKIVRSVKLHGRATCVMVVMIGRPMVRVVLFPVIAERHAQE